MTERQAWLTMARAYGTLRKNRTRHQKFLVRGGICDALLRLKDPPDYNIRRKMRATIYDSMPPWPWRGTYGLAQYFETLSPANDLLRADYCWFQYYRLGGE